MSHIQLNEQITEMQGWGKEGEGAGGEEASEKSTVCVDTRALTQQYFSGPLVLALLYLVGSSVVVEGVSVQISAEPHASKAFIFALLSLTFVPCTSAYLSRS